MVVERKISKEKYILAAILTTLLFVLGVALGMLVDNERLRGLEQTNKYQELDFRSLQFQYLYLTSLEDEKNSCPVLRATLQRTVRDLSESLDKYQNFKDDTQLNDEDYQVLGRRYLLDNLNYWLFASKSKKACGLDVVSILYFYNDKCTICPDQGVILTYFKTVHGDKLLVFPIDTGFSSSEPIIDIFLNRFNVTTYPTIIVENKKFEGVIGRNQLRQIICSNFKNESSC